GVAAAVISSNGRLRSANGQFAARMGNRMVETPGGLRFTDPFLQTQVHRALDPLRTGQRAIQSIAVPDGDDPATGFVIHLLPVVGAAREVCEADGVVMLLAEARNSNVPAADLLRLLFDLTPAEARLARLIAQGHSAPRAAAQLGIQANTARAHLKAIYAKTGLAGQTELALALTGLGAPGGD
ncbi:MAG: helix-turn-helix transcriptional regulator, partial [Sphingomonadales bacterium]|nr:helix-turn-helix transcriptional regulator [Sphingomonadales bacterium]